MAKIYANLISNDKYSYTKVRANLKQDVLAELRRCVVNGDMSEERFTELTGEMY